MFKDINELLDRIPLWKQLQEVPKRMAALEDRVAELEKRLERAPGEACPKCGALEMRLHKKGRSVGPEPNQWRTDIMKCQACGFEDEKVIRL